MKSINSITIYPPVDNEKLTKDSGESIILVHGLRREGSLMKSIHLTSQDKSAFFISVVTGLAAFGFIISHNLFTYDSMGNLYSNQNMIPSGRQFLTFACGISSNYDLHWLNGLLSIFYLALASVLIVRLFEVKSNLAAGLAGGMLVVFPSVTSTFAYSYTVDGYMFAVLLATCAVFCAAKYKYGVIPAVILLGVSIGIYQAYFSYAILLCIVLLIEELLCEPNFKRIVQRAVRFVVMVVGGYVFYVVTLKIMLKVEGMKLSGYQGSDRVASFQLPDIREGLESAWDSFYAFIFYENVLTTTSFMKIAFVGICLLSFVELIYLFIRGKCWRQWYRILSLVFLAAITPFCTCIIAVIAPGEVYMHLLTRMAWSVFFIFAMVLGEKIAGESIFERGVKNLNFLMGIIMIFQFVIVANIVGFNLNERYEKTYALCIRIVDHLESIPEYRHGMKVAILGGYPSEESYPSTSITDKDLSGYFGVNGDICINSTENYAEFMEHFLYFTIQTVSGEEEIRLNNCEEFFEMANFPYEGSIRLIDDVWVVRLDGP